MEVGQTIMAEKLEIYKCELCGIVVEVLHGGPMEIKCCGSSMKLYKENTEDAAREKHVPVVEKTTEGLHVKVGQIAHPMKEGHYIEWIEVISDGKAYRQFLNPGESPEAVFKFDADKISVREYCSLHGLWKA